MRAAVCRGRRVTDLLDLSLQVVVVYLMWVLGIESGSSTREATAQLLHCLSCPLPHLKETFGFVLCILAFV